MAFWGVEVRPGNPFTHFFDPQRGRLHISQATLGNGSASQKSVVQCNVGDKSPVLLCALLPDKTESCGLALEFEEAEDVTFSVVGPRSVYLTGYYLGHLRNSEFYDDIEPPGEDIENTDSEEADLSDGEDDSDDSFINDDDPEYFSPSPSPITDSGGDNDGEEPDDLKPGKRKGRKRRKKYQFSDSDDGGHVQISKEVNGRDRAIGLGSDDEELPNSSPRKTNNFGNNSEVEPEKRDEDDIGMVTKNAENSMEVEPEERNDKELGMIMKNTENDTELEPSKGDEKVIGLVTENSKNMEVEPEKRDDKELGMEANDYENNIKVRPEEGHGKDVGMATKKSENNLEVEPEKGDDKELGMEEKHSEKNIEVEPEEGDGKDIGMATRNSVNNMKVELEERDDKETSMVVKHSKNKIEVGPEERDDKEVDMATNNSENNMEVVPDKKDDKELCMTVKDSENNIEVEPEERDDQEIDMATKNFENNMEVKSEAWNAEEVGLVTRNPENDKELEPGKRDGKEIGMETNKDDICVAETSPESNVCLIDGDAKRQSDLSCKPLLPCPRPVSVEKEAKPKKKRKQLSEESTGEKATKVGVEKKKKHQEDQKSGNKKVNNLLSSEVMEDGPKQKKRRKERSKETDTVEADSVVPAEDKEGSATRKEVNIGNDESLNNMDDLKSAKKDEFHFRKSENCTNQDASGKKEKKKKKKVKNKKNDKEMDTTSAVRILSNGMEIEELDMGKPENKVADQGKRIKVTYTGKLVDGDIFDSNVNTRFCLGAGQVIEGLDIGIEGMRVGGRRRLKIPPSLGFGSEGDGEKVPPHSWLIYDIELLRVS